MTVPSLSFVLLLAAAFAVWCVLVLALVLRHRHLERVRRYRRRWGDVQAHVQVHRPDDRPAA